MEIVFTIWIYMRNIILMCFAFRIEMRIQVGGGWGAILICVHPTRLENLNENIMRIGVQNSWPAVDESIIFSIGCSTVRYSSIYTTCRRFVSVFRLEYLIGRTSATTTSASLTRPHSLSLSVASSMYIYFFLLPCKYILFATSHAE